MSRLRSNIVLKSIASILTVLTIIVFAVSTAGVIVCGVMEIYSDPQGFKVETDRELAYWKSNEVYTYLYYLDHKKIQNNEFELPEFLRVENTNFRFFLTDSDGDNVLSNVEADGNDYITDQISLELFCTLHKESRTYYQMEEAEAFLDALDRPNVRILSQEWVSDTDENGIPIHVLSIDWEEFTQVDYQIHFALSDSLTVKDEIYFCSEIIDVFIAMRWAMAIVSPSTMVLLILLLIYLCWASGYRKNRDKPIPNLLDRVPFDLYLFFWGWIIGSMIVLIMIIFREAWDIANPDLIVLSMVFLGVSAIIFSILLLSFILTITNRIKCGTFLKNTVIWRMLRLFGKGIRAVYRIVSFYVRNLHLYWKTAVAIIVLLCLELLALFSNSVGFIAICLVLTNLLLIPIAVYCIIQYKKLTAAAVRIAQGDTSYQINTDGMVLELKSHAQALNGIRLGMQKAVDERMKSERFKTELITNVSHDIKTPLTSIINYVDLLKKEEFHTDAAKAYVDVLERQSSRLKKLIEDLVEASKASTGNMIVHAEQIDLNLLIAQTTAEFYQKLDEKELTVVTDLTADQHCTVVADGRLLWRVLENLMSNVCKYAQEKTRLYIITEVGEQSVRLVLKNTSKYVLNITSEELMERFARGDASRHTEGSGLGLSIARSLIELQKGSFEVVIDGDLFKVIIELPKQ